MKCSAKILAARLLSNTKVKKENYKMMIIHDTKYHWNEVTCKMCVLST